MAQPDDDRLWTVADRPGRPFRRRVLRLAPDEWHALVEAEWAGALVLLRRGDVEVYGLERAFRRFDEGAVLCFDGLGTRALHNPGPLQAMLVGIFRRGA